MIATYKELAAICESPKAERLAGINKHSHDIERIIAEQAMGAILVNNMWVLDDASGTRFPRNLGLFENDGKMYATGAYYEPLFSADQSLAAVDKMIERGWDFQPKLCGMDFSAVEAFHHEKKLFVRALWWGGDSWRHATALSLAVAMACLREKENA